MSLSRYLAKTVANYDDKNSIASRIRAKRIQPLLDMIQVVFKKYGYVSIIDVGGTEMYWNIVPSQYLEDYNITITIVNLPSSDLPKNHGRFTFVGADACDLAIYENNSFHIAHSNSVVEHVGDWKRMKLFANEVLRIAEFHFVQTPNYWFPIEPHCMTLFFHWQPKPIRVWLIRHFRLGNWKKANSISQAVELVESARLLNKEMVQELFKDANIITERFFMLPKSLIAIKTPCDA